MRAAVLVCTAWALAAAGLYAVEARVTLGLDLHRPVPRENPLTPDSIALGRRLFHDRRLSRTGTLSCASCHVPSRSFAGSRPIAVDGPGRVVHRDVPTLVNRAWGKSFFWDGRASSLEAQVLEPILNVRELDMTPSLVLALARSRDYRPRFVRTFGAEPQIEQVARALASFVRTLVAGHSAYDRFTAGQHSALSAKARRGLGLFTGKAGCAGCHHGPNFTDEQFHNTGIAWRTGQLTDEGRAVVTRREQDRGAFKTPTLRQLAETAPYMHDGSLATLEAVIEHYDAGGLRAPALDVRLRRLNLDAAEKHDLAEFLRSLTGPVDDGR